MTDTLTKDSAGKGSYTFGHSAAFTSSHASRTAATNAFYLLPYIKPTSTILDVGCGPGTITRDFAAIATSGRVVGLDYSADVISKAQQQQPEAAAGAADRQRNNLTFQTGSAFALPFEDETFDIVHAHATFCHLPNPTHALAEMRRVCKTGGVVAIRECVMDTTTIHPDTEGLRKWKGVYPAVAASEGADMNAGRMLSTWACEVGYQREKIEVGATTFAYAGAEQTVWWGDLSAARLEEAGFREKIVSRGLYAEAEMDQMAEALRKWGREEHALYAMIMVHVLCWK